MNDPGEAHIWLLVEPPHQRFERPAPDLGIRVEEEDVAGVRRFQPSIVGVGKAAVHAPNDAYLRKLVPNEGGGPVSRFVVGDDDFEGTFAALIEDACEAGA